MTDSNDVTKAAARKNILQALGSPKLTPSWSHDSGDAEPTKEDEHRTKVVSTVKTLAAEVRKDPPPLPVKPAGLSPSSSRASSPSPKPPPRPPPPRPPPKMSSLEIDLSNRGRAVSPPASPMRRRSLDVKQVERPKPPTKRRNKFQTPGETVSIEENAIEDQAVNQSESSSQLTSDAWEVIPGIKISDNELHNKLEKMNSKDLEQPSDNKTNQSNESKANDQSNESSGVETESKLSNKSIDETIRALSVRKKKKPPPIRPYSERTPPLPPKKKKIVSIIEPDPVVETPDHGTADEDHIYEDLDKNDIRSRPENLPTSPMNKVPSVESLEGGASGSGLEARANTVGAFDRVALRGKQQQQLSPNKNRPLSTASSSSSRDLELSFEVIPNRGSNIEDVMSTLRMADERYQDASIYELIQACSRAMPHVTSTSELPARISNFPTTEERHQSIHELYTSEYTYVRSLEVLVDVFRDNLSPLIGDETSHVFANVDNILAFNKGFIALLHSRLLDWNEASCVGDIFIGMFTQAHKSMYAIYCSNYDTAEMIVNRLRKRKDIDQALAFCLQDSRIQPGLTLAAYLIVPIQRITRYILLLKDILKKTPEKHPDFRNLTIALETMNELAHYVDAQVSEAQTKKTLESLKNKVHGLTDLDSPARSLVKDGQVYLKSIKKLYQCILFNDLLVFAQGDSKQSRVELQLDLEAVWIEDLEDLDPQTSNQDAIEVYTPERPYTIYTQTRNEKRLWLTKLKETIYYHLLGKDRIQPSSVFRSEERFANFIYANDMVYSGEFIDAKRHGKGTMTWPNKTVYVGDWVDDQRCGEGEFTYNTGDVYRGKWAEDKQNGYGELQFASNDVFRGYWKDGIRHGEGKIYYANGDVFEGNFVSGQIEGRGVLKCTSGVEYNGDWKHSQRHGSGRLKTATGKLYKGEFQHNMINGTGTMTYQNRATYEGRWKNGMRHGHGVFKSKTMGTYEGSWDEDLRHGKGKLTYPNGDVYEGQWEHNRRHAQGKMVWSNNRSYEGEFHLDLIHGDGLMNYSKNSKYHGSWINGLRHGSGSMVYEDKASYTGDWAAGVRHGQGELVMSDGSVYRGLWLFDKPHGRGTLSIPLLSYTYNGDWVSGMREGRGEEQSQYGQYKGHWKADMKHGYGEERSLTGTIFEGTWDRNRKHGRGVRKMIFGHVDEQFWKAGQLLSDPAKMTAVELPFLNRSDF